MLSAGIVNPGVLVDRSRVVPWCGEGQDCMKGAMLERARPLLLQTSGWVQRLLLPLGLRTSRAVGGRKITFDPATDIGMQLLLTGRFEAPAIAQCARHIKPDSTVLDVGANIGVHAVQFADMAPQGNVICLEPARSTYAYLLRNVANVPNVIPLNVALSDAPGIQTFYVAADNGYSGLKDTRRKRVLRQEPVACFRADDLLAPLLHDKRIDLIKIDVEGLEMQVLQGMTALIAKHRPVIFCEIFGGQHSNPDPAGTVKFCVSLGYDPFVMSESQLIPATTHNDRLYNYFFIPR
jgi:FkbM family methyltransferase